jgi:hypothetical protein
MAKKSKWIQKAVNPKHKGYCTPMTKKTCTPARKAFARRAKAGKLQTGGTDQQIQPVNPQGSPSPASMFPTIDPNYDPLDQMGPHAEPGDFFEKQASNPGSFVNTNAGQKIASRYNKNSEYIKDANLGMTAVTNVANAIQGQKQKRDEYLTTLRSMTPKFMTNNNQGGLNNIPAYTMFGGDDRSIESMMLGGIEGPGQYDYSHKSNEEYGKEGIAHNAFYGKYSVIPEYKGGGEVSSAKAKEILRDGTAQGHALTDKQKRYFGWIAGGKKMMGGYQTGGQTPTPSPTQNAQSPESYYQASATLSYYKDKLNAQLKSKNPQAFGDYFKGLQGARKSGNQNQAGEYIQNAKYDEYLSPDEVKKVVGSDKDYQNYLNSLKEVNQYNVSQGHEPLYGSKEGENDPSKLNYGRRFASLQVDPTVETGDASTPNKHYRREYNYNPQTGKVDFSEKDNLSLRPQGLSAPADSAQQTVTTPAVTSRQYGGKKYMVGGMRSIHQTGGYNVGDEVELTAEQIAELKKQGYKIKVS